MTNKERILTKVTMEYSNGDKEYIEGKDAEIWKDALNSAIVSAHIHGSDIQYILKNII